VHDRSPYVIYPSISGEDKWRRVIALKEIEDLDSSLWEELLNFVKK